MPALTVKKAPSVAFILVLPLLLALGFWQLDRAEQKRALLALQDQNRSAAPVPLPTEIGDKADTFLYKTVRVDGHYDSAHQILQDNQISEGKPGYFVLTPLVTKDSKRAVLVNRGWLPYPSGRKNLPDIAVTNEDITVTGQINRFSRPGLVLAGAETPTETWPAVVQVVKPTFFSTKLGFPLHDFQIELDKSAPHGFKRDWQHIPAMPPEKHVAYAVQWFLLALTLCVLYLIYGIEKKHG